MRPLITAVLLSMLGMAHADEPVPAHPWVVFETTEGTVVMELDGRRAPLTVRNFLRLVDDGYYDGTIFHRVIKDFMVQGGGYTRDLESKEPDGGIPNESGNGLTHLRGTVAMARQDEPHTAMAQFFINLSDNKALNPGPERWGYAVFGYVVEGMDVVDKMTEIPTAPAGPFDKDVPVVPIIIEKAYRKAD